jgi:hypothetical protein
VPEPKAFLALDHAEDPDWTQPLERALGLEREPQRAGVELACCEFAQVVQDARAAEEEQAAQDSPQWLSVAEP